MNNFLLICPPFTKLSSFHSFKVYFQANTNINFFPFLFYTSENAYTLFCLFWLLLFTSISQHSLCSYGKKSMCHLIVYPGRPFTHHLYKHDIIYLTSSIGMDIWEDFSRLLLQAMLHYFCYMDYFILVRIYLQSKFSQSRIADPKSKYHCILIHHRDCNIYIPLELQAKARLLIFLPANCII